MASISRPLSAAEVSSYYRAEYSSASSTYYAESSELFGDWQGQIEKTFGLAGQRVRAEHFDRLALGQHPLAGEQLVQHRDTIRTREDGEVAHRSAWDLTLSPAKSVSLAALVGRDDRIVEAHRAAVCDALSQAEALIKAQMGGRHVPLNETRDAAAPAWRVQNRIFASPGAEETGELRRARTAS